MKVSHRIVGDPPKCGFGYRASTKAFPSDIDAKWVRDAEDVRFTARLRPQEGEGVSEVDSALEFQSVGYGRFAAVRSAMGMVPGARPHGYTDIAVIEPAAGETLSAAELLSFDCFIRLEKFWQLDKSDTVLPDDIAPTELTPLQPIETSGPVLLEDEEAQLLLALRYWKAASERLFDKVIPQPVRVLLGVEDSKRLVDEAKRFFMTKIASLLPEQTQNILSLSIGVRANAANKFRPTALVFLYPGDQAEQDGMVFVPGRPWIGPKDEEKAELVFLEAFQDNESLSMKPVLDLAKNANCEALAVDFEAAFAAWLLENPIERCKTVESAMSVWHKLDERIERVAEVKDENTRAELLKPMARSIREAFGTKAIYILPMCIRYDEKRIEAIKAALEQLKMDYTETWPTKELCEMTFGKAAKINPKLDDENEKILTDYHKSCFDNDPDKYGREMKVITTKMGFDTTRIAETILREWAAPERAAGVTPKEVSALLEGLCLLDDQKELKPISGCEAVKEALASLTKERYLADGATALSWVEALTRFFGENDPQPEELRTMAVRMRCGTAEVPLPEEDFDQAYNWLAGGACGQGTADACAALLKLCEQHCADGAGKAHAEKMIRARFVGSVEGYPALCALTKEAAAVDLTRALNADESMPSCLRRADALCAKTRAADAGGKLSEALFLRPEVRSAAEGHFRRHMEENFTPEGLVGCAKELAETDYSPYPKVKTLGYGILYKEVMQNKDVLLQGTAGWRDWNGLRAFADRCRSLGACGAVPAKDFEMLGEAEAAIRALNGDDAFSAAPAGPEGIAKALDFGRKLLGAVGSGEIPLENAQAIGRLLRDATGEAVQNGPWAEMSAKDASMPQRAGMPFAARIAAALYGECAARDGRRFPRLVKEMTGMEPGSAEKLGGDDAARVLMAAGALFRLLENAETEVPGAARDLLQEANAGDMVALRETLAKKADALMIRGINKGEYGAENAFTRWLGRGKTV